jgi:hypothetical protein
VHCLIGYNRPTLCTDYIPLFITQAPTCFDTLCHLQGASFNLVSCLKVRNGCVIGMYPCTVNVGVHRMFGFVRRQSKNVWQLFCNRFLKRPLLTVSRSFMNVANRVLWSMAIILKANKVNLFVSSVLFVFWDHSPDFFRHTTYTELLVKPVILTSYIYGPMFGNAEIRLFLFAVQCFNTESMQKCYRNYRWDLIRSVKG